MFLSFSEVERQTRHSRVTMKNRPLVLLNKDAAAVAIIDLNKLIEREELMKSHKLNTQTAALINSNI